MSRDNSKHNYLTKFNLGYIKTDFVSLESHLCFSAPALTEVFKSNYHNGDQNFALVSNVILFQILANFSVATSVSKVKLKRRISHVENLIQELTACDMRRLNQIRQCQIKY